ncbi:MULTISPECIES: short-chain dehydrogenase [Bacillus cereus group]|uniref:short-chain dehydrogenase n=1 Tax=Bacillus cereus group TaxID=86661 RepID=UPI000A3038A2|nr:MULTISPECIES: short-chain dehydrogenase [Bacillus cereus group]MCU5591564.1 short-chain dehydrogenase [Bacillus mobilis]MCU5738430.1 short-chain dehydrogenase [Bacillus mobilis]MCU9562296.1 short-chain dehydrogenase [Bacillus mobilis]MCX9098942.1 short-chain dehydrogenase [Bacillus anthracis]PEC10902.1 short-chain dehydrogenase [Bacillus toyonensis]
MLKNVMRDIKKELSYERNTEKRMDEVLREIDKHNLNDYFHTFNAKKVTSDSKTTTTVNEILDFLAGYILESENLTTKKNDYNILDEKRMKDVEMNEQALPSYSSDTEETTAEFELTSALINKERLLKYEDTVYQLLKGDYELINNDAMFEDLWCYQTLQNEDARGLIEGIYNTMQYYLSEISTTRSKKKMIINRKRIKELLYGDIGSIVRSYTKFETIQKRTGERANKKYVAESSEDIVTNKHQQIFKWLVADKSAITNPNEIIPIIDLEQVIEKNIESGLLDEKDVEMINLLKNHYKGDLVECLKVSGRRTTYRYRLERLINKLEKIC